MNEPLTFVNPERAKAEAARFVGLSNMEAESRAESWFAIQAAADEIGPASNLGIRGLSWTVCAGRPRYNMQIACVNGRVQTNTGAPPTLEEAASSPYIDRARALLERAIEEHGGERNRRHRSDGTSAALVAAVKATPEGVRWVSGHKDAGVALLKMVKVADVYGRDGVFPQAGLAAHLAFLGFENRADLIRAFPTQDAAAAKAMSLRRGTDEVTVQRKAVSSRQITQAMRASGAPRFAVRAVLLAMRNGYSKRQMVRLVNLAAEMVAEDPRNHIEGIAA